jgi:hypothetical protein
MIFGDEFKFIAAHLPTAKPFWLLVLTPNKKCFFISKTETGLKTT